MEQKFLSRKQKRKFERRQKKEKKNEYYMNRFSKNRINKKNKNKNTRANLNENNQIENENKKTKNLNKKAENKNNKKNILFDDEQIDISDMNLEKISNKKEEIGKDKEKKEKKDKNNSKKIQEDKSPEIKIKKEKDDIDLDLEYLEKKLQLNDKDTMKRYKKSMALDNYDEDIFDFLDNIDSAVEKGIDKYKKYDPNNFKKKEDNDQENDEGNEEEEDNEEFEDEENEEEDEDEEENEEENENENKKDDEEEEEGEDEHEEDEKEKVNKKIKNKEKKEELTKEMKQYNEELEKQFRKELNSLLNKIAEANLVLILQAIFDKITAFMDAYQDKKTKVETTYKILSEILIKTTLYQQVINLPIISCICTFVSLLHYIKFGQSFICYFIKKCLEELNNFKPISTSEKQIEKYKYKNFIFIIIHLYIFENINSVLIYDLIRYFIDNFTESNSEYLLLLLSYTGISIRKENPSNLKDIIVLINMKYNNLKLTNDTGITDKMKYIIGMINDIKQNKYLKFNLQEKFNFFKEIISKRKSEAILIGEKIEIELEKIIKLSYDKILSNDIITNKEKFDDIVDLDTDNLIIKETQEDSKITKQLNDTMKKLGISTGLKKMIFTNIATSNNVNDAFERLCRLNLNKEQKREIIKMIVKLCIEEPSYNPFYQLLLVKLLTLDKDNKYTYHYCVWDYMKIFDKFKNVKKIHNLSKLTSNLLLGEKISLPVLLHFKFEEDNDENKLFINMILNKYFSESNEDLTKLLFAKLVKNDEHVEFAQKLFNYLVKDFNQENNVEKKDSKYQDNYGAALKVLKKVL